MPGWGHALLAHPAIAASLPPEVFEPVRRRRCVDRGAGDRAMAEPGCRDLCSRERSRRHGAAAVLNGDPRSLMKTKGDVGLLGLQTAQGAGACAIGLVGAMAHFDPQRMMAKRTR
jgi:hypothetical protein